MKPKQRGHSLSGSLSNGYFPFQPCPSLAQSKERALKAWLTSAFISLESLFNILFMCTIGGRFFQPCRLILQKGCGVTKSCVLGKSIDNDFNNTLLQANIKAFVCVCVCLLVCKKQAVPEKEKGPEFTRRHIRVEMMIWFMYFK